mmetsp:Transcript_14284/g.14382  ORF Transcript_14284/g.14382 Transcript_14284/m.14382 type:complete len:271 (-) Transcript_14284:61-873(-)
MTNTDRPRILVCCSGSVATVKVPEIVNELSSFADVRILCSSSAAYHFLERARRYSPQNWNTFYHEGGMNKIIYNENEWDFWDKIGDPVIHIELRRWADLILVAPASADILAKIAAGISDTLLLSVLRALDLKSKPCVICPAMNTFMWDHPSTEMACRILERWGWIIVNPAVKLLACNDQGKGALASVSDIIHIVKSKLEIIHEYSTYTTDLVPMLQSDWPVNPLLRLYHTTRRTWMKSWRNHQETLCLLSIGMIVFSVTILRSNANAVSM